MSSYTRELLISQLQKLAKQLERSPSWSDVSRASKQGACASSPTFAKIFGSFNAAKEAAGLAANKRETARA
jgi:hypothetical protein